MTEPLYVGGAGGYVNCLRGSHARSFQPYWDHPYTPGHRVLDVATGTGAAAEAAAEIVGPAGEVCAGDVSSTMLDVARRD